MKYFWISLLSLFTTVAVAADRAGEVVFAVGEVSVRQGDAQKPLKRGDQLFAGDVLVTGGNGHIHVRTVDQGFVSLRPASRLIIEQYHYNPANARETAIKFRLEDGVMRSVTGKGGEAAKDRFRLNTPVAAIGIRGTDFSVYANRSETRVSILSGGVAVSPFNDSCQAAALGPCSGQSVQNMYAGSLDQVLQVRRNSARPRLLRDSNRVLAPEVVAPPLPEEKDSQASGNSKRPEQSGLATLLASETTLADVATDKTALLSTPAPTPAPVLAKLEWGRWGGTPGEVLAKPGQELIIFDPPYFIVRTTDQMALPERGNFEFNLSNAQAGVYRSGALVGAATVDKGTLSVDFGKREFSTALTVTAATAKMELSAKGSLSGDGKLTGAGLSENMSVKGALNGDGTEASYLFMSRPLADGRTVQGITNWKR